MKLIAIEGPDGSGKSTFLTELVCSRPNLNIPIWHSGGPVHDAADFRRRIAFITGVETMIVDRLPFISEWVYCKALKKPLLINANEYWDGVLQLDPIIVYCRLDDQEEMLRNMLVHKPHKTPEYIEQLRLSHPRVVQEYDKMMTSLIIDDGIRVIRHNWKRPEFNTAETIKAVWQEYDQRGG